MNKFLLVVLLVVVVLGGSYIWYQRQYGAQLFLQPSVDTETGRRSATPPDVSWRFESAPADASPRTTVFIVYNGTSTPVGTFDGNCSEVNGSSLRTKEISGVLCYWSGTGDEIGLFADKDRYVVMHSIRREPGSQTGEAPSGFVELFTLK